MTNWQGNDGGWGGDAPVFSTNCDYEWGGTVWPYPDVWITVQAWEPTEERTGRDCIWHYTPEDDEEGWEALKYGARYYDEGMGCRAEDEQDKRVLCFRAAELLYLHAASKGNPYAFLNLGYVYSYDRCEGQYWDTRGNWLLEESERKPFPRDEKAYEHFLHAAEADIAEACYKVGDLLRDGRGCEVDLAAAFRWFQKAYDLGKHQEPVIWGSAALRLGRAFEEGEGCEQSFEESQTWYQRAQTGLEIAVRKGESWYRGPLRHAQDGLARTKQELSGEY